MQSPPYSLYDIEHYNLSFFKGIDLYNFIKEKKDAFEDERLYKWALKEKNGVYVNFNKMYFFVTLLDYYQNSSYPKKTEHDYFPTTAKFLKGRFKTKNYKDPIKVLKILGIVESRETYSSGAPNKEKQKKFSPNKDQKPFPKGYRLERPYLDFELITVHEGKLLRKKTETQPEPPLSSKLPPSRKTQGSKTSNKAKKSPLPISPETEYLKECLAKLSFDSQTFFLSVDDIDFAGRKEKKSAKLMADELSANSDNCFPSPRISKSKWTGRITSSLTSQKRELRPYMQKDGSPLVSIDMHACQPFLLMAFYDDIEDQKSQIQLEKHKWAKFFEGDFYENIGKLISSESEDREIWKPAVLFNFLCCRKPKANGKKVAELLTKSFPLLSDRIKFVKSHQILPNEYFLAEKDRQPKEKNYHRQMASFLQELEAGVFIDTVCKEASEQKKYVLTVHDELMVEKCDVDFFRDRLILATREKTAYAGILKIKYFDKKGQISKSETFNAEFLNDLNSWSKKLATPKTL
jgi:hypothetical protein